MADALLSIALEKLTSFLQQQGTLAGDAQEELGKLFTTLRKIRVVVDDAEQKQVKDELVKIWLKELKDVAYDVEDVLDEWYTKILRSQIEGDADNARPRKRKVSSCLSSIFSIVKDNNMGRRIKEIRERLDYIANEKDKYGFTEGRMIEEQEERMTSSLIDVSMVYGRAEDKTIIISQLLGESSQQEMGAPLIISIFGMGGFGKTTLAQLVFNDENVKNHFEKRMWVCVSEPFNMIRLAKAIIEEVEGHVPNVSEWQALHRCLSNAVKGKKFLLVLDDVWTEDDTHWKPLKLSLNGGAQGSRIVVTTRNKTVAMTLDATYNHHLGRLSDDDCWSLFSRIAFAGRQEEECKMLEELSRKITKKCEGMPLAAKTMGGFMRFKRKQDWEHLLESETWKFTAGGQQGILSALMLSYYNLPSYLKRCFAYCAIYPKGWLIKKDELIKEWMAQGFLSSKESTELEELEKIGEEYFDNLRMRSLFQDSRKDNDGFCNMHDLVHDLLQYLTKNECSILKLSNSTELNCSNPRHLWLRNDDVDINFIPPSIYKVKNLRTLIICWGSDVSPLELSRDISQLTCLRILDLSYTKLENLPSEVEKMIHLRWLDLSSTRLKEIPETVSNLCNLQTLKLNKCKELCKLPKGMGRMINLRHLEIEDDDELRYLPQGIGKLSSLRTLSKFIVGGESGGCNIGELKNLNLLQGYLIIIGLGEVANVNEANEAEFKKKQYLRDLHLNFEGSTFRNVGEGKVERMEGVLECLEPHKKLERLKIDDYPGSKWPSWLRDSTLSNLISLELNGIENCTQFSSFGLLPSLKELKLVKMDKVKHIGPEFYGIKGGGIEIVFPKLKTLHIHDMLNLEEWDLRVLKDGQIMTCLCELSLRNCPKLKALPALGKLASLESLQICGMKELKRVDVEFLGINDDGYDPTQTSTGKIAAFPKLKSLSFGGMEELEEWEMTMKEGEIMPYLHFLELWDCPKLKMVPPHIFPDALTHLLIKNLTSKMDECVFPKPLPCLPNLISLSIYGSPHLSCLPEGLGQLTTLKYLLIGGCESLMCMSRELEPLTALELLYVVGCPILGPRCRKETGEDWSIISHIPKIYINGIWI